MIKKGDWILRQFEDAEGNKSFKAAKYLRFLGVQNKTAWAQIEMENKISAVPMDYLVVPAK